VAAYGLMTDLMWSDPELSIDGWAENTRGISYTFGADVVRSFCRQHNIAMVVRGHQVTPSHCSHFDESENCSHPGSGCPALQRLQVLRRYAHAHTVLGAQLLQNNAE